EASGLETRARALNQKLDRPLVSRAPRKAVTRTLLALDGQHVFDALVRMVLGGLTAVALTLVIAFTAVELASQVGEIRGGGQGAAPASNDDLAELAARLISPPIRSPTDRLRLRRCTRVHCRPTRASTSRSRPVRTLSAACFGSEPTRTLHSIRSSTSRAAPTTSHPSMSASSRKRDSPRRPPPSRCSPED